MKQNIMLNNSNMFLSADVLVSLPCPKLADLFTDYTYVRRQLSEKQASKRIESHKAHY